MTPPQIAIVIKLPLLFTKNLSSTITRPPSLNAPAPQSCSRFVASEDWRRGRDSNPRWPLSQSGFQDRRDRPLCHLSDDKLAGGPSRSSPALGRTSPPSHSRAAARSGFAASEGWHGRRESNPQPTVLETATLPIELLPFPPNLRTKRETEDSKSPSPGLKPSYFITSLTRPAPIVRPPSRMAKRCPFSIATGAINSISTETLSPGITISTPWGSVTVPVTSDVRK
jgi:hypothetical protein